MNDTNTYCPSTTIGVVLEKRLDEDTMLFYYPDRVWAQVAENQDPGALFGPFHHDGGMLMIVSSRGIEFIGLCPSPCRLPDTPVLYTRREKRHPLDVRQHALSTYVLDDWDRAGQLDSRYQLVPSV